MRNDAIDGMPAQPFDVSFYRSRNYFTEECEPSAKIDCNRRYEDIDSWEQSFRFSWNWLREFDCLSNFHKHNRSRLRIPDLRPVFIVCFYFKNFLSNVLKCKYVSVIGLQHLEIIFKMILNIKEQTINT